MGGRCPGVPLDPPIIYSSGFAALDVEGHLHAMGTEDVRRSRPDPGSGVEDLDSRYRSLQLVRKTR